MITQQKSTEESVLVVTLYQSSLGKIFLPLLISNKWNSPFWRIPGGGVENLEDPESAALRELFEETGLLASEFFPLMTILKRSWENSQKKHRQLVYIAQVENINTFTNKALDGDDELSAELFPVEKIRDCLVKRNQLNNYKILPSHERILIEAFKKLDFI